MNDQVPFEFADGKDPHAFRTIGEVAQAFGIKQHVLRYWEEQFPMLKPLKRAGGRRYYRAEDVALVGQISRLLYQEGFTIRGARQALGGKGTRKPEAASLAEERPGEELERSAPAPLGEDATTRLREIRDTLSRGLQRG